MGVTEIQKVEGKMKVKDIAFKEAICADQNSNITEVAAFMRRHNIGAVPVCNSSHVVGMLTDRDIIVGCLASGRDPKNCLAKDYMTANPVCVSPDATLEEAAKIMGKNQIRRLPVVEGGELVGMLSLGDLVMASCDNDLVAETVRRVSSPNHTVPVCT